MTATSTVRATETATSTVTTTRNHIPVVAGGGLISSATFTRADEATYFDSDGILQTAAANEARTTYIDGVPLLLMEGGRENLLTRSEEFDHADWTDGSELSVVADQKTAPDGTEAMDELTASVAGVLAFIYNTATVSAETDYTFSFWALAGTIDQPRLAVYDETNASFIDVDVNYTPGVSEASRITHSFTTPAGCTSVRAYLLRNPADTGTVYLWGAQLEEGTHESSYIETTTAAVTRSADSASLANSIIASLTEGVVYMEILSEHLTSDAARHIAELESDANNFIRAQLAADGDIDGQITSGGTSQAALAGPAHTPGQLHKVALVFGPSGFALYSDGVQRATGTGTVPSVDTLLIGAGLYGGIKTMNVEVSERSQASAEALTS